MLTDTACRQALPGPKKRKLSDALGLFLQVLPTGSKSWRFKYRLAGKERQLVIGPYPEVSLAKARVARDQARAQLAQGIDPAALKAKRKAAHAQEALDSFESVARAWHELKKASWVPRYADQVISRLEENIFPRFGKSSIKEVTPPVVLDALRRIEARGAKEMAHRVRMHVSDVFVWAIAAGLAEQDPASIVRKALQPTDPKLRPAVVKVPAARKVLEKTEALEDVYWATALASRLLALTAARPGVVRLAERSEFEDLDGTSPLWRIPAAKMKLTRQRKRDASFEFIVPLSRQAVQVVLAAMGASPSPQWLFPGIAGWRKPITNSTLSKHYRRAGFANRHTPHGWRASFSTIMNERAAHEDRERDRAIIDLMLAHVAEGVEAAYNRAAYMPRRRELAQAWADLIMEGRPSPDQLVPERIRAREASHDGGLRKPAHRTTGLA